MAERMAALRLRFIERASQDVDALVAAHAAGDGETIRRVAHSLAGNAGMFGFVEIGELARAVEDATTQYGGTVHAKLLNALLAGLRRIDPKSR